MSTVTGGHRTGATSPPHHSVVANPIARSKATDNTKAIAGRMRAFRAHRDWRPGA